VQLTAAQAGMVYEAVVKDLNAGGLGRRYLLADEHYLTQVYRNEVCLTFYGIFPGWTTEKDPGTAEQKAGSATVRFNIQTDSIHLIAALRELGILDSEHTLVTQMEAAKAEGQAYDG
jgi:hypothetical protein